MNNIPLCYSVTDNMPSIPLWERITAFSVVTHDIRKLLTCGKLVLQAFLLNPFVGKNYSDVARNTVTQGANQHTRKKKTMKKVKEESDSIIFEEEFNGRQVTFSYEKRTGKIFIPTLSADLLYTREGREFVSRAKGRIKRLLNN